MNFRIAFQISAVILLFTTPAFAIFGAGIHWGFDFTTSMDNSKNENIFTTSDLDTDELGFDVDLSQFKDSSFLYVTRKDFERTPINFGGKLFIDILPIEFEVSMNMGVWQYDGMINYLDIPNSTKDSLNYIGKPITIEDLGGDNYFGVDKTPYGKLHLDLSVKKTFDKIPFVKPSLGGGVSFHFATPVLSADLVKRALDIGDDLSNLDPNILTSNDAMKKILTEITDGAKKPKTGMHLMLGVKVKPPVIPLALYVDGKYMIFINDIEDGVGVKSGGLLLNLGIMFNI